MRVGIHTGMVVVGEMGGGGRQEQLALGETPNLAARLQALAAPDTIVISGATQHLVQGMFAYEDLGAHTLKGVATPMRVFRVLREREAKNGARLGCERWTYATPGAGARGGDAAGSGGPR